MLYCTGYWTRRDNPLISDTGITVRLDAILAGEGPAVEYASYVTYPVPSSYKMSTSSGMSVGNVYVALEIEEKRCGRCIS